MVSDTVERTFNVSDPGHDRTAYDVADAKSIYINIVYIYSIYIYKNIYINNYGDIKHPCLNPPFTLMKYIYIYIYIQKSSHLYIKRAHIYK